MAPDSGVAQMAAREAHILKVAGSSPAPAPNREGSATGNYAEE